MLSDAAKAIEATISETIKAGEVRAKQSIINSKKALEQTIKDSAIHSKNIAKESKNYKKIGRIGRH